MKKIQQQKDCSPLRIVGFFGLGIVTGTLLLFAIARLTWHSKFYPGISIAHVAVGGLNRQQAREKMNQAINNYQARLVFNGNEWVVPGDAVKYDLEMSLNGAYQYGRRLRMEDYLLLLVNVKSNYPLIPYEGKTEKLESLINEVANSVEIAPVEAGVVAIGGKVVVNNGSDGTILDTQRLDGEIREKYANLDDEAIGVPTIVVKQQLSQDKIEQLKERAEKILLDTLTLVMGDENIILRGSELVGLLANTATEQKVSEARVAEYVTGLSESLDRDPQDARFEFDQGKVEEFAPGKDGIKIKKPDLELKIKEAIELLIENGEREMRIEIPVDKTPPKITTEKVNELGIRERIGRGESFYQHSIPNRIYNVALASSRLNSALVPPGEEVSFNKLVGEVSAATGYRQAYIISGGRTVLGDGGGLCQVSTTMFRAAMNAGLPILERWGHAYRVSYYELNSKPGVDATVIAPSKDFKFRNDTPGHILIQTINDPKALHLVIEIYGTSDGRVATISEPKVWGVSPPLPTIYQDDPTLPTGTAKQVDWAASGAKASFEYKVTRSGETLQEKTFTTSYQPWASVFLRGTGI